MLLKLLLFLCNSVNGINCSKQQLLYMFLITHLHVYVYVHRHMTHACIHNYTHCLNFPASSSDPVFSLEVLIPSLYRFPFPNYSLSSSLIRPAFYPRRFPRNSREHPRLGRSLGIYTCKLSVSFANVNVTYTSDIFKYTVLQLGCKLLFYCYTVLTHVTLVLGKSVSISNRLFHEQNGISLLTCIIIINCKHISFCIDLPQSSVSKDIDTTEVIVIVNI